MASDRLDTRVRFQERHVDAIEAEMARTGKSRNKTIEDALDRAYGLAQPHSPRLAKPDPNASIGQAPPADSANRTRPRLQMPGKIMEAQSAKRTPRRMP